MSSSKQLLLLTLLLIPFGCNRDRGKLASTPLVEAVQLLANNEPAKALVRCDEVIAAEPENPIATLVRGQICEALDDTVGARTAYERTLLLRPYDREATYRLKKLKHRNDVRLAAQEAGKEGTVRFVAHKARNDEYELTQEESSPKTYPGVYPTSDNLNREPNTTRPKPIPKPRLSAFERAIMEGQRLDANAQEAARMEMMMRDRYAREEQQRLSQPEMHITRFDFGLGDVQLTATNTPTTGRQRTFIEPEEETPHEQLLFGQAIARPLCTQELRPQFFDAPTRTMGSVPFAYQRPPPTCSDGIDNDRNGLADKDDPNCWLDKNGPASYHRMLDEFISVDPFDDKRRADSAPTEASATLSSEGVATGEPATIGPAPSIPANIVPSTANPLPAAAPAPAAPSGGAASAAPPPPC